MKDIINKIIAMSGGVDSSAAAALTSKSCEASAGVTAVMHGDGAIAESAARVCESLAIPHISIDCTDYFDRYVISKFVSDYELGITPNPCIECNRRVKFGKLLTEALSMGYTSLVTGHYANIVRIGGSYYLTAAADSCKDQSYVLYTIPRASLDKIEFPLGGLTKREVRELAFELKLPGADNKESQDICFIPDGNYSEFIRTRTGKTYSSGVFTDTKGTILGRHSGALEYTVGQRRGLGISFSEPLYVKSKQGDTIILAPNIELYSHRLKAKSVNILVPDKLTGAFRCEAKVRYRHKAQPCTAEITGPDELSITFDEPVRAITPGQSAVLYDGTTVLGGGLINYTY